MSKKKAINRKASPYVIPLVLLLAVVPLVVHYYKFPSGLSQFDWYASEDAVDDVFLYYKSLLVTLISAVMCVLLLFRYRINRKTFKPGRMFLPILSYAALTVLSTIISPYKYFSFHGASEVYETLWVILGYCIIVFYAYQSVNSAQDISFLMKWLTAGLAVMLAIGLLQVCGHDIFLTGFGKMLITGSLNSPDHVRPVFEQGRVFLTLYNPNYVASYFALMIPVEVSLLAVSQKPLFRILYAAMLAASMVCLLASGNRSGIAAFGVTALLALILFWRRIIKAWKAILPAAAAAAVIAAAFLANNNYILEKFARSIHPPAWESNAISQIQTGDADVTITYRGENFHVAYRTDEEGYILVTMQDGNGTEIDSTFDREQSLYTVADGRFHGFTVKLGTINGEIALLVHADGLDWCFQKGKDGTYYYYNRFGKWDKISRAPRIAEEFLVRRFEERGTIWSKTLPMLKNSLILGTGADTFTVTYPQDDYVDKVYKNRETQIDVKPHSFYLQVATQSGIPAMLAVLVFYAWYFIQSIRLYQKEALNSGLGKIGAGLMFATFTYMVTGILNDSTVAVAPVFWVMVGIGGAVNQMLWNPQALAGSQSR